MTLTSALRPARWAVLLIGALALLWIAGCGGDGGSDTTAATSTAAASELDGLSAQQVLDKAKAAAKSAASVHAVGQSTSGEDDISLDLTLVRGQGGEGTIKLNGGQVDLVLIGDDVYFKADEKTFSQALGASSAEVVKLIGDKYIKADASDKRFTDFAGFLNIDSLMDQILTPDGTITLVAGKPVNGVPTVGLKDEAKDSGGVLYVADQGTPYPMLVESAPDANPGGTFTLSDWDKPVTLTAPPADQVIDLSKLPS